MLIDKVENLFIDNIFFQPKNYYPDINVYLKIENFNLAGSIKLKPAKYMIEKAEQQGVLNQKSKIIESTSGNMGVAFSHICASKRYPFICVTDVKATSHNINTMRSLGAEVIVINELDKNLGYVENRLKYIKDRMENDPNIVWLNQYNNESNILSHYEMTAKSILNEFSSIDYLFVGAGTTGTLMGCIKYFEKASPHTMIIGVDAVGSVLFSIEKRKRFLPGIGSSRLPEIFNRQLIKEFILINEVETVEHCRKLALEYGMLAGASTGSVMAAISHFTDKLKKKSTVVAISSDGGQGYLDTIYNDDWVNNTLLPYYQELNL